MKLDIRGHHLDLTAGLRAHVEAKLDPLIRHHEKSIQEVQVRLEDETGPHKKGVDKACRITVYLTGLDPTMVEVNDRDMYLAIDRAIDQVDRAVQRRIERMRPDIGS